jgi:hypothetical protein
VAVTQLPGATSWAVPVTVWVKVVAAVHCTEVVPEN